MRLHGCWAPLVAGVAALGVAGCGTSAPVTKPTVNVAITAPTSGATVGVRDVTVTGTVTPATAQVLVGGQPATRPRRQLPAHAAARRLRPRPSRSPPRPPATPRLKPPRRVSYSAGLAAQLAAASRTLGAPTPSAAVSLSAPGTRPSASLLAQAVALPKAAAGRQAAPPGRRRVAHEPRHRRPPPLRHRRRPRRCPRRLRLRSPPRAPAPAPPSPAAIAARVKQQWESNCLQKQMGTKEVPYCTCIYTHLRAHGSVQDPGDGQAARPARQPLHAHR